MAAKKFAERAISVSNTLKKQFSSLSHIRESFNVKRVVEAYPKLYLRKTQLFLTESISNANDLQERQKKIFFTLWNKQYAACSVISSLKFCCYYNTIGRTTFEKEDSGEKQKCRFIEGRIKDSKHDIEKIIKQVECTEILGKSTIYDFQKRIHRYFTGVLFSENIAHHGTSVSSLWFILRRTAYRLKDERLRLNFVMTFRMPSF